MKLVRDGLLAAEIDDRAQCNPTVRAEFPEPGVFLVRPDGTLYMAAINSMPFARPHFDEILAAVEYVLSKDYPARGEVE